ncbi:MAG: cysteine desulfurase family protein [Candidatus Methylomirabilales bacterium]
MHVYLDHNATTPLHADVLAAMTTAYARFGNPSSLHEAGRAARQALEEARTALAHAAGATDKDTVVFTSGGTEADNLALKGLAFGQRARGRHLIVSSVEHHAVLHAAAWLATQGFEVTRLPVDAAGRLDPDDLRRALRPDTILVSVMHGNNETGVLFPVADLAALCRERGVAFHTDAVQTLGKVPVDWAALGVDLLSLSAHKIQGPPGIGALLVRRGITMQPLLHGGSQERSRRAGTENVPAAVGFAAAARRAVADLPAQAARLRRLRDRLEDGLLAAVPDVVVNGREAARLPHTSSLAFLGLEAESLILALDLQGIAVSSGAACSSGSLEPSHVLLAMGLPRARVQASVRFSLGPSTTAEEIEHVLTVVPGVVERLRRVRVPFRQAAGARA